MATGTEVLLTRSPEEADGHYFSAFPECKQGSKMMTFI